MGGIDRVINLANLMYEHWNYSAVELCLPTKILTFSTPR